MEVWRPWVRDLRKRTKDLRQRSKRCRRHLQVWHPLVDQVLCESHKDLAAHHLLRASIIGRSLNKKNISQVLSANSTTTSTIINSSNIKEPSVTFRVLNGAVSNPHQQSKMPIKTSSLQIFYITHISIQHHRDILKVLLEQTFSTDRRFQRWSKTWVTGVEPVVVGHHLWTHLTISLFSRYNSSPNSKKAGSLRSSRR
jgi:hypothetical protein